MSTKNELEKEVVRLCDAIERVEEAKAEANAGYNDSLKSLKEERHEALVQLKAHEEQGASPLIEEIEKLRPGVEGVSLSSRDKTVNLRPKNEIDLDGETVAKIRKGLGNIQKGLGPDGAMTITHDGKSTTLHGK